MSNIIRAFSKGFTRGIMKSVDIGNTSKPHRRRLQEGENIQKSWEHVGNSMRKSLKQHAHVK